VHLIKRASLRGDVKPPSIPASRAFPLRISSSEYRYSLDSRRKSLLQIAFADPLLSPYRSGSDFHRALFERSQAPPAIQNFLPRVIRYSRHRNVILSLVLCSFFPAFPFLVSLMTRPIIINASLSPPPCILPCLPGIRNQRAEAILASRSPSTLVANESSTRNENKPRRVAISDYDREGEKERERERALSDSRDVARQAA